MRRVIILAAVAAASGLAAEPDRYLKAARTFIETMMARGADRYGTVHSPLFAAMLDLKTLSLPVASLPEEYYTRSNGSLAAFGYGLPDPPVGIRPHDRAPVGDNLEHDIMLLGAMYELSALAGEPKYARHADAYLRFWLENCQSPATGLMATGEHMSWDFFRERAYGNIHEVFRRFPFWDKLYAIDPYRALRIADALWLAQIGNKRVGDFSRHAGWREYKADTGAAYPRHAGFYVWAYANAYVQSRDPKYINRVEVLIESRTGKRPQAFSLLVEPGAWEPERSLDANLRLCLWDAAGLVPERRDAWRALVRELDEAAFAQERRARPAPAPSTLSDADRKRAEPYARLAHSGRVLLPAGGLRTESTTLSAQWRMGYGSSGVSGRALQNLTRYQQTGDARFLRLAETAADAYVAEGIPKVRHDLWPKACGQVISLLAALSREDAVSAANKPRYMAFARELADMAIELFGRNGLFRADGLAEHYEAITGADDLVWALLQLHCAVTGAPRQPGHIDVNW